MSRVNPITRPMAPVLVIATIGLIPIAMAAAMPKEVQTTSQSAYPSSALTDPLSPQRPSQSYSLQSSDGPVEFSYPPRLTDSYSTRNLAGESNPTYYLTIDVPVASLEPLDRLVISLTEGYDPTFRYRPEATAAFVNTPEGRQPITLGKVEEDRTNQTLAVGFSPAVPPGQNIILALRPGRNPRYAGVYLFGVQAYPVGEKAQPSFAGYARLSFYERDGFHLWP